MVFLQNTFENGPNGTTLSNANSGSGTDNVFDVLSAGIVGVTTSFSGVTQAHGLLSALVKTGGTSGGSYFGWSTSMGTVSTLFGRAYFFPTAVATTSDNIISFQNSGVFGGIRYDTAGKISTVNAGGSVTHTSTSALTLNRWARIEWKLVCGAAGVGSLLVNVYQASSYDTSTISFTLTDNTSAFGSSGSINEILFGWTTANINQPALYIDDVAISTTGFLGPAFVVPAYPVFPTNPLGISVQLLINGALQDITGLVRESSDIDISGRGRPNETSDIQSATLTLTLNNTGGIFSPNNANSIFFPFIQTNTQIYVSVSAQSVNGTSYSGYRFIGEVRKWPPSWDPTGTNVYVSVTAAGILTRYIQGSNIGSTLRRFYTRKTDNTYPIAYWACEELTGANSFQNLIPSGTSMTWGTPPPSLSSDSSVNGSDPIPQFSGSTWTGNTGAPVFNGPITWSSPGKYIFIGPGNTTSLSTVKSIGGGAGGSNGVHEIGGGGGECAVDTSVAITPGVPYVVSVGAGGAGGQSSNTTAFQGSKGGDSYFQADSVTTLAHGAGTNNSGNATFGGSGSSSATHHNGGNGGTGHSPGGGGGGGGSGGTAAAGNNGSPATSIPGGGGGPAVTGGGAGGYGETFQQFPVTYVANLAKGGGAPGGGGGSGSSQNVYGSKFGPGAVGSSGQVTINFTSSTTPNSVVIRFIIDVPSAGMPNNAIIMKASVSGGTMSGGRMEAYYSTSAGGTIGFRGFNSSSSLIFDTGTGTYSVNGVGPKMYSLELIKSGSSVNGTIQNIAPGDLHASVPLLDPFTGTIGTVTQIICNPNGTIQDTAMGHILLQYTLEPLINVSQALNGFAGELAIDRFKRLCSEEGITCVYHSDAWWSWDMLTPYQNSYTTTSLSEWTSTNSNLSPYPDWSSYGPNSLLMCNQGTSSGAVVTSPQFPVIGNSSASVYVDLNTLGTAGSYELSISFWDGTGTLISTTTTSASSAPSPFYVLNLSSTQNPIPSNATSASISVFNTATPSTAGQQFAIDNASIAIGVAMGPQPDDTFMNILQQIEDADRGMIIESRDFFGIRYVCRNAMFNQDPQLILNYTGAQLAQQLQPVWDEALIRNNITLSRINGSSVNVQLTTGNLSIQTPPNGVGNYPYSPSVNFNSDSQLPACGAWILIDGTVNDYRYTEIIIDQTRSEVASLFAAVANIDISQHINTFNVPSFMPLPTIDQIAASFDELLNTYKWTINITGIPYDPYASNIDLSGDFWNTGIIGTWNGLNGSASILSTITSPYGYYIQYTTSAANDGIVGSAFTVTPNTSYTIFWAVKVNGGTTINMQLFLTSGLNVTPSGSSWAFGSTQVTTGSSQVTANLAAIPQTTFPVTFQIGYFICIPTSEVLSW